MNVSETVPPGSASSDRPRKLAFISGKGGSGKTIISAVAAQLIGVSGRGVLSVDADTGTGGLTYYLGLKRVPNLAVGLADIFELNLKPGARRRSIASDDDPADVSQSAARPARRRRSTPVQIPEGSIQPLKGTSNGSFLGTGDIDRIFALEQQEEIPSLLRAIVEQLSGWMVVDCRGGIDRDSISVCEAVDDIILIVEPDTTSFQASQNVVKILTRTGLAHKLRGFIINKAFDNPEEVARQGTAVFRCQFLAAIPMDLDSITLETRRRSGFRKRAILGALPHDSPGSSARGR